MQQRSKTSKRPVTACNTANVGQKCAIVITRNDVTSGAARVYDLLNYSTPDGALVAQKKGKVKFADGRWRKKGPNFVVITFVWLRCVEGIYWKGSTFFCCRLILIGLKLSTSQLTQK